MSTTKAQRIEARSNLLALLSPNQTVYTVLRSHNGQGTSRVIDLLMVTHEGRIRSIGYLAAKAMNDRWEDKHGGIRIRGGGQDMGFALVYNLGATLWPQGTPEPHGTRNGEPDSTGGYALKHQWI